MLLAWPAVGDSDESPCRQIRAVDGEGAKVGSTRHVLAVKAYYRATTRAFEKTHCASR